MSLVKGNELFRSGKFQQAIVEYKKIDKSSPLYCQAEFNIKNALNIIQLENGSECKFDAASNYKTPLLSIIMPVFNVDPYLDASILSILHQTFDNFELIIVNDASTDDSGMIIDMYAKLDNRIKKINLKCNTLGGAGIPSNIGIEQAKGKYIGFVDSDDFIARDAFEMLIINAEKSDADVVIGDFNNFDQISRDIDTAYDKPAWEGLPVGRVFSAKEFPKVFRLSPVPWRKLYKREFLHENGILFPEGDYFYEDNPLHWFVLLNAERVVLVDKVVAFHRMAREGQSMGASNYKFSAIISHINTVATYIINKKVDLPSVFSHELLDYIYRSDWVVSRQDKEVIRNIIKKRYVQVCTKVLEQQHSDQEIHKLRPSFRKLREEYSLACKDTDLTIIIPVYNCAQFIEETLHKLTEFKKITVDVLLMDDGSDDNSGIICQRFCETHENFHLFTQKNRGAGRARNAVIPLCCGEFTYFLDADDTIEINELEEAVILAKKGQHDLLLFKYSINYYDENKTRNMFDADQNIWNSLLETNSPDERSYLALGLINYPWNRIISSNLLHDANIFFGPTIVHNDIPFHWHSLLASNNLGIFDKVVCVHRKFSSRAQITNINDDRRLLVFEALRHTQRIISRYDKYSNIKSAWSKFSLNLLEWAEARVSEDLKAKFRDEKINFLSSI